MIRPVRLYETGPALVAVSFAYLMANVAPMLYIFTLYHSSWSGWLPRSQTTLLSPCPFNECAIN